MRKLLNKSGRTKSTHHFNFFPESQHPESPKTDFSLDLPLSPPPPKAPSPRPQNSLNRSNTVAERVSERHSVAIASAGDRRSIAVFPSAEQGLGVFVPDYSQQYHTPDDIRPPSPKPAAGLGRAQTVSARGGAEHRRLHSASPYEYDSRDPPSPLWSSDYAQPPAQPEQFVPYYADEASMSGVQPNAPGKTSSDSGQSTTLDRWSQRRLQRLYTERGFREQRQGGQSSILSPPPHSDHAATSAASAPYLSAEAQQTVHQQLQPHPATQTAYQNSRTGQAGHPNADLTNQNQPGSNPTRPPTYLQQESSQQQYSPPDSTPQFQTQDVSRPVTTQSRSYSVGPSDDPSMSTSNNNGGLPAPKATRANVSNRQSFHNGLSARETSGLGSAQAGNPQQGGVAFNSSGAPPAQPYKGAQGQQQDIGRITPQPLQIGEDMSEDDINQLVKDHKELREKYTKVKKYYFEKEDQVKQLQNSLAHQRLSQSRTSLDDSEYSTRFNRLDGLVAQLAFSIRKSWKSIPPWLLGSVNKDAVATGKQEMTAAGRAFISSWLVEEVFNKSFHPDLDPALSSQLKQIQTNIRRFAVPPQNAEEEEHLISKTVNWRLATLEGLQEVLRSPECPANRAKLTDMLKEQLISALAVHLIDPPPSDLEGGVHMIIELVVSIAIHLPLESRDVVIDYFSPGTSIVGDQMKLESGIPPLSISIADDAAERASMKSSASDITEMTETSNAQDPPRKRSMLSAITGSNKDKNSAQTKRAGAGGSSSSLSRPESSQGMKEETPPRVRMAAGIGVQIRGRSVLVKAPVFTT